MRWKNDSTYQGNAQNDDFYFHSPIADADTWVFMSEGFKANLKRSMLSLDESYGRSIVTPSYLNSYDHPDYLWLMYELNNLRRAYNNSQKNPYTGELLEGRKEIPYVQIRLKETATSNKSVYPSSTLNAYGSEKKPHYVIEFEYPFLRAFMNFLFTVFDDNPQQLAEVNGRTFVIHQYKAPIYRQAPFDRYFSTRHDLPAMIFHKAVQMLLAHELAHVGGGHLDLIKSDPTFGKARDTVLVEEDDADAQAISWLFGLRFLEVPFNQLDISYDDFMQELALTVFAVYLLYTWDYSKDERVWTGREIEDYHHNNEDHLPYQLRAFQMLNRACQRFKNLGEWAQKGCVKTSDGQAVTASTFNKVFDEAVDMINAFETALHLFYAHTENVYESALNQNIEELQQMAIQEQDNHVDLTKHNFPWLLGFEDWAQHELKRLHDLWPSVRERLEANGTYCELRPIVPWFSI